MEKWLKRIAAILMCTLVTFTYSIGVVWAADDEDAIDVKTDEASEEVQDEIESVDDPSAIAADEGQLMAEDSNLSPEESLSDDKTLDDNPGQGEKTIISDSDKDESNEKSVNTAPTEKEEDKKQIVNNSEQPNKNLTLSYMQSVQSIYFSKDKVVGGDTLTVTMRLSSDHEWADSATLYLEGKLNDSNYSQIQVSMNKFATNMYRGTVVTRDYSDPGRNYYPSFMEIYDTSGNSYLEYLINERFPSANFTVFQSEEEMITEYITVAPGGRSQSLNVHLSGVSSYDFSYPIASIIIEDTGVADIQRTGYGFGSDDCFVSFYIQGITAGTTKVVVYDTLTGEACRIFQVTVNTPETISQTICIGDSVSVPVEVNSTGIRFRFSQSVDYKDATFLYNDDYTSYDSTVIETNSNYLTYRSGTFSVQINTMGTFNLYLYDNNMHHIKTIAVTVQEHQYGEGTIIQSKNCKQHEIVEYKCSNCGVTKQEEGTEYGDHQWNNNYTIDQEETCTSDGSKSIHCSICNAVDESTVTVIPKKGHSYGDWTVTKEATCTETGSQEKVCANCGDVVQETIPAKGHVWNKEYTVDKEATCTEDGRKSIHCSVCDSIDESTITVVPKKGHSYGEWTVTKEATCLEAGSKEKVCTECGAKEVEEIPAKGEHTWDSGKVTKKATASAAGVKTYTCTVCQATKTETIAKVAALTGKVTILNTVANSAKKTNDVIWDKSKVTGATGYIIEWRARGATKWASTRVGNVTRGVTSGLTIGNLYEIRVTPYKAATASTEEVKGTPSDIVYRYFFTTQKIRLASNSKGTFTMSWAKDSKATSYQVLYTTNSNGAGAAQNIKTVGASATSITVKDIKVSGKVQALKSGTTYYVQVREVRSVGGKNYIGNISCPVAVKVK